MIAEMLHNEGIDARVMATSFFGGALLAEAGLLTPDGGEWKIVVPEDQEARAKEILEELEKVGELQPDLDDENL